MKRQTVGKIATDLAQKTPDTRDPIEQMREQLADYDRNVHDCVNRYKKQFPEDFYVVVLTKKERLLKNVLRHYFTGRLSCPTPDYDQTVYRYKRLEDSIDFLWVIPSQDTCKMLHASAHEVVPSEWQLLQYVLEFADGTLFKKAKALNGEQVDSSLLVT